jgi:predicted TIM-barrel enzyme
MGFGREVDVIRLAHDLDLLTCPYVFNEEEAQAMVDAGADLLVAHVGLTSAGKIGAMTTITLDDAVKRIQAVHDAAKRVRKDILVLCHGGPIAEPQDAAYVFARTEGIGGFFGASSIERLPTERAITKQVQEFKSIRAGSGLRLRRRI